MGNGGRIIVYSHADGLISTIRKGIENGYGRSTLDCKSFHITIE